MIRFWKTYFASEVAREISTYSPYFENLINVGSHSPHTHNGDDGLIFKKIKRGNAGRASGTSLYFINGHLNFDMDIHGSLEALHQKMNDRSRVCVVLYNPYMRWIFALTNFLKLRKGPTPTVFVTRQDLVSIARLAGFDLVRLRPKVFLPFSGFGAVHLLNRILQLLPGIRWGALASVAVLRPRVKRGLKPAPTVSILIPARNERGNIENALKRLEPLKKFEGSEIIFIEGGSTDQTWEEIERVIPIYSKSFLIRALKQKGRGKNDAVRAGVAVASNELVIILDADLTVPPEALPRFVAAFEQGHGDFINGSRLVYPIEGNEMRFLNLLGNIFFAKALTYLLETPLGDALCGTKVFLKKDYDRFVAWREDFGDFDPFGDFELLFPAAILGLKIVNLPIAYRARTYGSTNISRFKHGLMLLKMVLVGLMRVRS